VAPDKIESPMKETLGAEPWRRADGEGSDGEEVAPGADVTGDEGEGEGIARVGRGSQRSTAPPRCT